jgi:hypothetical protein
MSVYLPCDREVPGRYSAYPAVTDDRWKRFRLSTRNGKIDGMKAVIPGKRGKVDGDMSVYPPKRGR